MHKTKWYQLFISIIIIYSSFTLAMEPKKSTKERTIGQIAAEMDKQKYKDLIDRVLQKDLTITPKEKEDLYNKYLLEHPAVLMYLGSITEEDKWAIEFGDKGLDELKNDALVKYYIALTKAKGKEFGNSSHPTPILDEMYSDLEATDSVKKYILLLIKFQDENIKELKGKKALQAYLMLKDDPAIIKPDHLEKVEH